MRIDYVVLADAAMAVQGKHFLLGAGWDSILAASFPLSYPSIGVAVRLRGTPGETLSPHRLEIDVVDESNRSILPNPPGPLQATISADRSAAPSMGRDQVLCVAFTLAGVTIPQEGTYAIVVRLDDDAEVQCPFEVIALPSAAG